MSEEEKINELWNLLYYAKRKYTRGSDNYVKVYHVIAKLYLACDRLPPLFQAATQQQILERFINPLLKKLKRFPTEGSNANWTSRYRGQFLMKKATVFGVESTKNLAKAYQLFTALLKLKTTQTNALLAAQIILDHNFTPPGMTRDGAIAHAHALIE